MRSSVGERSAREAYGEKRWIGFAPIGRAVYCVVFTETDEVYRLVSLRKATPKEVRDDARHITLRPDL
ncbi:BrnT family toxin [Thiorhodococcus minor]|uniref:BrnT family toxin n=1 Tax=Thiorhodococcus minor TaxID=57489 RepID=UPI003CC91DAE